MVVAWHGRIMASANQTRPHYVNQVGKTHSKHLASRHGRGTAWELHAMCESALKPYYAEHPQTLICWAPSNLIMLGTLKPYYAGHPQTLLCWAPSNLIMLGTIKPYYAGHPQTLLCWAPSNPVRVRYIWKCIRLRSKILQSSVDSTMQVLNL